MKVIKIVIAVLCLTGFVSCKTSGGGGGPCPAYGNNIDMQNAPIENVASMTNSVTTNSQV